MNNTERADWINNDEGLYDWKRSTRLSMTEFIKQNRAEIDAAIDNVVNSRKPAHYLKYGGFPLPCCPQTRSWKVTGK